MRYALRQHWPEYLIEAAALGTFMVSACLVGCLLGLPASPLAQALPDPGQRRVLAGLAMGTTALALIYSPWGKRSGAHLNPAVTLTFLRLGKVRPWDAAFYVAAQFAGGVLGVLLAAVLLGPAIADARVNYVVTRPGPAGVGIAFAAERAISFLMMSVVLASTSRPRLAPFTGVFAACLVATFISLESPLSGMSMNPARSLGSALPAGVFDALWLYFVAPPLGMLLAAEARRAHDGRREHCAKLVHDRAYACIFCGQPAAGQE